MAFEKIHAAFTHAAPAAADLTGKLHYFATVDGNGDIAIAGDGGPIVGVITEEAVAGKPATIAWGAIVKVKAAAATNEGIRVASDNAGLAVVAAVGDFEFGTVLQGCGGANQFISVAWSPGRRHA